jgi:hypothetical protein
MGVCLSSGDIKPIRPHQQNAVWGLFVIAQLFITVA